MRGFNTWVALALWGALPAGAGDVCRADLHAHVIMRKALGPFFQGEPGHGALAWSPRSRLRNQIDPAQLRVWGVRLLVASVWPPWAVRPGLSPRDTALYQLDQLQAFCRRHPELLIATGSAAARDALHRTEAVVLIPAVEGGEGLESADDLDLYYARGARVLTLMHLQDSALGGAAAGQLSRLFGARPEPNARGLSPLGKAVVERAIALGMLIDLAHTSDATQSDVLDLLESAGAPGVNTHTGSRSLHPMERNLSDQGARRIVRSGGMVGVTLYDAFVDGVPEGERFPGYAPGTCDDVIAHWLHFAKAVGAAQVTLGSDLNGMISRPGAGGSCPEGLRNTHDLGALYDGLEKQGLDRTALDESGFRFLDVLERAEQRANPLAQALARTRTGPRPDPFAVPF